DRRALPRPSRPGPDAAAQPPQTPVQQRCARIWEEVLGVPGVGLGDDFFSLGGHSLKAVRVLFRVREAFGAAPALRTLFETPTLEAFAAAVCGATAAAEPSSGPASGERSAVLAGAGRIQRVSRRGRS